MKDCIDNAIAKMREGDANHEEQVAEWLFPFFQLSNMVESLEKEEADFEKTVLEVLKSSAKGLSSCSTEEIIDFVWAYFKEGKKLGANRLDRFLAKINKN